MKMRLLTTVNGRGPSLRGTVHVRYPFMSEGAKCVQGSLRRARVLFFSGGNGEVFSSEVWDAFVHRQAADDFASAFPAAILNKPQCLINPH
jgi:hypothetical protein